jgi:predicted DNA-binding transcriptional regulator YafY
MAEDQRTLAPLADDEIVAVLVALRAIAGIEPSALTALAKLKPLLPGRLTELADAVATHPVAIAVMAPAPSADLLEAVLSACIAQRILRFDYRDGGGAHSERTVEPYRLEHGGRHWYLLAWDLGRDDWRTFRVDRLRVRGTGETFTPREVPDGVPGHVIRRDAPETAPHRARILLHAPADAVAEWIPRALGRVEPLDQQRCLLDASVANLSVLAGCLAMLDVDFEVRSPVELRRTLATLAERFQRAANTTGQPR